MGEQLNAYDVLRHRKLLITRQALEALLADGGEAAE
jgi:ribosomal protein L4